MKTKNVETKDMSELIDLIKHAATTYKEACSEYSDKNIEKFMSQLAENHKDFVEKAINKYKKSSTPETLTAKYHIKPDVTFKNGSAIALLLLCKDIEKKILDHTRAAVHNSDGEAKIMLCKQLTFSEKALFKADRMLENYE